MAAITLTVSVRDTTKSVTSKPASSLSITTGTHEHKGTDATAVGEGSITIDSNITSGFGPGLTMLKNLDATDSIDVGTGTGDLDQTLGPGEVCVLMLEDGETTIYHQASANTPALYFEIYERNA